MKTRNWTVRLGIVALIVIAGSLAGVASAGSATAATVCSGDVCVITGGFAGLQADIAGSGGSGAIVNLLSSEVALSQALHPPNPCYVGHPPSPCTPAFGFLPSAYLLVLVDYQAALLSRILQPSCPGGCGFPGLQPACPGGCGFPPGAARTIDADIRTMLADTTMYPPGMPSLPALPPAPTS